MPAAGPASGPAWPDWYSAGSHCSGAAHAGRQPTAPSSPGLMPGSSRSGHQIALGPRGIVDAAPDCREGGGMRSQKTLQGIALSTAGVAAVLMLASCGLGQPQSQTTTTPAGPGTGSASPSQSAPPAT